MQKEINKLVKWCNDVGLKLCKSKSKAMLFSRNRRKKIKIESLKKLKIEDNDIEYTECMNYLGINIDSGLS